MPKSLWIHGVSGKMGRELESLAKSKPDLSFHGGSSIETSDDEMLKGLTESQLVIDFSSPAGNASLIAKLKNLQNKSVLICTTGLSEGALQDIKSLGKHHRIMVAANTSLGVLVFSKILGEFGQLLFHSDFDIELLETHHRHKIDAPSGTLKFLRHALDPENTLTDCHEYTGQRKKKEIGIHSIRGGGVAGEHTARFISESEEISITHRAFQRSLFATGALVLLKLLDQKSLGFYEYGSISTEELLKVMKASQKQ